ncbi:hypothetical protein MyChFU_50020 [Mycobacterium intracellulare subsp. chimaera]
MALSAVLLYVVFAALGFGWRSWRQWRRTGSTGFRGVSGRFGSLEWIAGAGLVAAIVTGVMAPLLQLGGVLSPLDVLHATWIQTTGVVVAVAGIGATVYAQNDMGESWRIGSIPGRQRPWCVTARSRSCATRSSPRCSRSPPASCS